MANQTPPRTFTRYIVNLPALSIEFLDVFPSLYPPGTFIAQNLPIVHCYCFTNADDPHRDVIQVRWTFNFHRAVLIKCLSVSVHCSSYLKLLQRASERIGHDLSNDPSVSVLEVRDVSPKKLFMCLSFKVPLCVLERTGANNKRKPVDDASVPAAAAGAVSDSKKVILCIVNVKLSVQPTVLDALI